jgi:UPF0716 protein FxsA
LGDGHPRRSVPLIGLLALLFLVVPIAELAVIITVASEIGVVETIAALIVISVLGAWLAKREGIGVWQRFQAAIRDRRVPATEVADGALILFAGALMLTPGFLTDLLALVLLVPLTRAFVRGLLLRRLRTRVSVIDADSWRSS